MKYKQIKNKIYKISFIFSSWSFYEVRVIKKEKKEEEDNGYFILQPKHKPGLDFQKIGFFYFYFVGG